MIIQEGAGNIPQQSFVQWNDPQGNKLIAINRDGTIFANGGLLVPPITMPPPSGTPLEVISANTVPIVHGAVSLMSQTSTLKLEGEAEDESVLHLMSFYVDSHLDGGGNPGDNTLSVYLTWTDPSGGPINTIVGVVDGVDPNHRFLYLTLPILPFAGSSIDINTVYAGATNNKHFTYDIAVCKMHLPLDGYPAEDQFVVTNSGTIPTPILTGTFTLGDLLTLPSYDFWLNNDWLTVASDTISINNTNVTGYQSALQVSLDGGPSTNEVTGINCLVNGSNSVYALNFKCSIEGNGGYAAGIIGNATTKDSTAIHSNLFGGYFCVGPFYEGGQADYVAGVQVTSFGDTTGTVAAYGLDVNLVCADMSSGTATGIWIEPDSPYTGLQGHTKYAIKSDTLAPSVFAGSLSATTLIEANTLTPSSGATAGVTGQIAWDSGFVYICTAGGIAGSATWKKAALTTA